MDFEKDEMKYGRVNESFLWKSKVRRIFCNFMSYPLYDNGTNS